MIRVKKDQQKRLLDNAKHMYEVAESKWAKAYWNHVYTNLLKKFKRLN